MGSIDALGCEHFSLVELCASRIAGMRGISNLPPHPAIVNLRRLGADLETIREFAAEGRPIRIHSGYRSFALNEAVGGQPTSNHLFGLAADFHCTRIPTSTLFDAIRRLRKRELLVWDECLHEVHGTVEWVHFAAAADPEKPLMKTLLGVKHDGKMHWSDPGPLPEDEVSLAA